MVEEFPSNSNEATRKSGPQTPKANVKKIDQITRGEVKRRKKPLGTRFKETFFGGEGARGVFAFVMGEVLVPAAKDMVADATTQAVERAVFGESRRGPRGWRGANTGPVGHVRYDGYSRGGGSAAPWNRGQQREVSQRGRSLHNFDEIILDSRGEAEQVLDTLQEIINEYKEATVADLYGLCGISSAYTDQKYGWTNLQGARAQHIRGGQYLLDLPKPEALD